MPHKVLYLNAAPQAHRDVTLSVEPPEFEHEFIEQDDTPEQVRAKLAEAEFMVGGRVTAEQIAAAPKLRMIQMPGVGYEHIDVEAAEAPRAEQTAEPAADDHDLVLRLHHPPS